MSLAPKNQLRHKDILVDLNQRRVWKNKMELDLTPKEFDLLVVFLKHPGMVFTRERLLQMVWGYDFLGNQGGGHSSLQVAGKNRRRSQVPQDHTHQERSRILL